MDFLYYNNFDYVPIINYNKLELNFMTFELKSLTALIAYNKL
jgi:hypothetical protein